MSELKPCPFCGMPFRLVNRPWSDGASGYEVEHVDEMAAAKAQCAMTMACYSSIAEAERGVNTRHERTCAMEVYHGDHGPEPRFEGDVWTMTYACSACHGHISPGDVYCKHCGAKVVSA